MQLLALDPGHISHLKIQKLTSSLTGRPCFKVWDTAGFLYEFGCTADSLEYYTDVIDRHDYLWNVDKIVAPNEGSAVGSYRVIRITYLQDMTKDPTNTYDIVRDSAIQQITYGTATGISMSDTSLATIVGTVDFH